MNYLYKIYYIIIKIYNIVIKIDVLFNLIVS